MARIITVKLPEYLLVDIDTLAAKFGVTRSELIREAITAFIKDIKRETPVSGYVVKRGKIRKVIIA